MKTLSIISGQNGTEKLCTVFWILRIIPLGWGSYCITNIIFESITNTNLKFYKIILKSIILCLEHLIYNRNCLSRYTNSSSGAVASYPCGTLQFTSCFSGFFSSCRLISSFLSLLVIFLVIVVLSVLESTKFW